MKYMLLKSRELIRINIVKYIIVYYFLTLLYTLINKNLFVDGSLSIGCCLGLIPLIECNDIEIMLKITSIILLIFLSYKILLFDITSNIENLYLRCNSKKILLINIFIILLFITVMRLILLFILSLFLKVNFNIILLDLIYCYFVSISSILILNLIVKKKCLYKILLFIVIIILMYFTLININVIYLIGISFVFLLLIFPIYSLQELNNFIK